jgi:hypothetical protein
VLGSFAGGGILFLLACPLLLARRSRRAFGAVLVGAALLFVALRSRFGGFNAGQSLMLVIFIGSSLAFVLLAGACLRPRDDARDRFLLLWILVGLLELVAVMPWTATRYLLLVLPAAVWIFVGQVGRLADAGFWRRAWALTALTTLLLAFADYGQAETVRHLAAILKGRQEQLEALAPRSKQRWYYLGDTFDGAQPYLNPLGWENIFPTQAVKSGDLLLKSHFRQSAWWQFPHRERLRSVMAVDIKGQPPLRVMDVPASAGFYASVWGALPFVLTDHPLERFELYQVK